jgi:hypothetical protein
MIIPGAVIVCLLALSAWLTLRAPISGWWKAAIIPTAFAGSFLVLWLLTFQLGVPIEVPMVPERSQLFAHRVMIEQGKKKRIEVWLAEPDAASRLYSVPYTKPLEKALEAARKAREGGQESWLERRKKGGGQEPRGEKDIPDDGEYHLDLKRPEDRMTPKEGAPEHDPKSDREQPASGMTT